MENKPTCESSTGKSSTLRWPIGAKLIIAFLALSIIPMSVTATYNLAQSRGEVARVARENLMELSRSTAHRIEGLLVENQRTSATLAGEPVAAQFLAASEEEREALTPQVYQTLQNFADTHPDYDAPGLLDANGIVLASLAEVLVGKDRSFRDYFQASIQGQPYVSSMLVGRATGRPGVFLTNPVVTAEGEIVGIDIVWLKGDAIWSIIDDVVVGEEGIAYLVDQDGVIIAHPDRDLLYHSLGKLTPEAVETISATIRFGTVEGTDTPLIPESLGMDDLAAELASPLISGGKSGTYRYDSPLDHRAHVVGYTFLEAYPWVVVVDLPEAQFLTPLRRLATVAWGSVGVVAVLTLIVSILLLGGITHPIRRLTDVASAVERGQPFEPADIEDVTSGHDEIAHLGRVFSGMVLAFQQEITDRKQAEERIEHLNLVLSAIRGVNQLIIREKDCDRLLQGACDNLIETRGCHSAWIALLDESGGLVTAAEAGLGEEFLPLAEQLERGELTDCGRRALTQSGVVVTEDPLSACADCPLSKNYGGRGALTVRLEHRGKVYGLSSISIPAHLAADEEERSLFQEVATDIAFALHSIELEEERKRAEEEFRESEERLKTILDSIQMGVVVIDAETHVIVDANPVAIEMVGVPKEQIVGRVCHKFICPAEEGKCPITDLGQTVDKSERVLVKANGEIVPILKTVTSIILSGRRHLIDSFLDITEQKQAEAELLLKDLVFEASITANSISDNHGILTHVNSAFIKIWGYENAEEVVGKPISDFLKFENEAMRVITALNESGEWAGEYTALRKDGSTFNAYGLGTIIKDKSGDIIGYQSAVLDISDQKQAEEELGAYHDHLEELVAARTAELDVRVTEVEQLNRGMTNLLDDLQAATRTATRTAQRLEVTNDELEAFVHSVSHDLRAPLRHVDRFAQLLLQRDAAQLEPTSARYLQNIVQAAGKMGRLIDDLLALSRTSQTEMKLRRVAPNEIVEQVRQELEPAIEGRRITWEIAPLPAVQADPGLLRVVWTNLLSNAVKYTAPRPQARIEIGAAPPDDEGQVTFFIRDDGVGFDPLYAHKLFGVFQRLHRDEEFEGTGIGLATVRRIIHRHGGRVWAEGEVDHGATFYFTLRS